MEYRAVGNRCAVNLTAWQSPVSHAKVMEILLAKGFQVLTIDVLELARGLRSSTYRRRASLSVAPDLVDCSSATKWLYGERGIWLPRRAVQQRECGTVVNLEHLEALDLVFISGRTNYYRTNPSDGVGHVGIATSPTTVLHARGRCKGVEEVSLEAFLARGKFRGARRCIPKGHEVITLQTPPALEIETEDDIRWIILESHRKHT